MLRCFQSTSTTTMTQKPTPTKYFSRSKVLTLMLILWGQQPTALAYFNNQSLSADLITGAFYTDQPGIVGTVTPWRFVVYYKQKVDPHSELDMRLNSQTGIVSGPYIDGFNTKQENFNIETIKYTRNLTESLKGRLGYGKIKANVIKQGGTITPMPFSNAMARLPLQASDIALGLEKKSSFYNGSYTVGTAVSNISNTTESSKRQYSMFYEVFLKHNHGSRWLQYSHNNLVEIFASDHYFSTGADYTVHNNTVNAAIYLGVIEGWLGFDCGYKRTHIKPLYDSTLGIGYGISDELQSTLEISLEKKFPYNTSVVTSWYVQHPHTGNTDTFNVAGVKITHRL